jgi:hypothetical protein
MVCSSGKSGEKNRIHFGASGAFVGGAHIAILTWCSHEEKLRKLTVCSNQHRLCHVRINFKQLPAKQLCSRRGACTLPSMMCKLHLTYQGP